MIAPSPSFSDALSLHGLQLRRRTLEILQINTGKLCNLTCAHCHVNAGPKRKEIISRTTIDRILAWLAHAPIHTVDLTGGAPEMIPDFHHLITSLRTLPHLHTIIDRCNLTILNHPGFESMAHFLASHQISIVASMPCYNPENVNAQRGDGVFDSSIAALQKLNALGYGRTPTLRLDLVYNPLGSHLPPPQDQLQADYKRELKLHYGIDFHHLYCITNMPIARFRSWLKNNHQLEPYMDLLRQSFNPAAVDSLMCRHTLSVDWQGLVYDCDFNQQLGLPWTPTRPTHLWDLDPASLTDRPIASADHCFACTAGCGSSCSGSLVP